MSNPSWGKTPASSHPEQALGDDRKSGTLPSGAGASSPSLSAAQADSEAEQETAQPPDGRASVTDVNGSVARFDMSYTAERADRQVFGPPLRAKAPSYAYLGFALALVGTVIAAYLGQGGSRLYVWIVEGDRTRPVSAVVLSLIVLASAIATVVRAHMRGVIVHSDGIEARYLLAMGIPRVRRWAWTQIEHLVVDEGGVGVDLWDGTYEPLPPVAEPRQLAAVLEKIATARRIRVLRRGKTG